ncbi:MAG: hypothetical protein E7603_10575 [Ruminococcaceae bacterium]|nr:hypothetical protein [Oscillospiraceae bacterium]
MMLFLTACNQTPPNETTTGNLQNQEQPQNSELKDTIIRNGHREFIDLPSRILFECIVPEGEEYTFYYSKADRKAYVYCFDPLCDHSGKCLANPRDDKNIFHSELRSTFFINNRFYVVADYGQIFSMAFDGTDIRIEYSEESYMPQKLNYNLWSQNYRAYGKYIYIPTNVDENEKYNLLRFNTETKEMENLTEKTGNYMYPSFFYNGKIYGSDIRGLNWFKADLEMKNMESIEELPVSNQFYGSVFFDCAYERIDSKTDKYLGIETYDMKTGETKLITNEMLELEANRYTIVAVDENYLYFYQYKKIPIGTYIDYKGIERKIYNTNEGKLYRVKHDGTECTLIYDNSNFEFVSLEAVISGDQIIIEGRDISVQDGNVVYNHGIKIGTIGPDGKIDKFENIELVY